MKKALLARLKSGGFTMIELLIVISILGILAVMVLAAINPLEQINRGRDTAKRGDAEQLLGAVERYNAFQGIYPWRTTTGGGVTTEISALVQVTATAPLDMVGGCPILTKLSQTSGTCLGSEELKASYVTKIGAFSAARGLYIYNEDSDTTSNNTYVCFSPESYAFEQEAENRCYNSGVIRTAPSDLDLVWNIVCNNSVANAAGEQKPMVCLP